MPMPEQLRAAQVRAKAHQHAARVTRAAVRDALRHAALLDVRDVEVTVDADRIQIDVHARPWHQIDQIARVLAGVAGPVEIDDRTVRAYRPIGD